MSNWTNKRWALGTAVLEPGRGGISRVSRMSARTIIDAVGSAELFSLVDTQPHDISGVTSKPLNGSKIGFAKASHMAALHNDIFLYDSVGPARAHPRIPGLKRPYGVWIHGVEVWENFSPDRARALQHASFVLVNSEFTKAKFEDLHFPLRNAYVCPLATEEDTPGPSEIMAEAKPTALLIGRSDTANFRKGHREVIAAWDLVTAQIPDAQLLLAGGGDGLDLLKKTVETSPARDNISVLGFVPEEEIPALWARSHAFVQPSWKEGFGLVYIEAMRHSKPVIASIHDAGQEVNAHDKTGFNVDLNDREALAGRIVELLSNPQKAATMGRAGLARWHSNYRYTAFSERLRTILDHVSEDLGL